MRAAALITFLASAITLAACSADDTGTTPVVPSNTQDTGQTDPGTTTNDTTATSDVTANDEGPTPDVPGPSPDAVIEDTLDPSDTPVSDTVIPPPGHQPPMSAVRQPWLFG